MIKSNSREIAIKCTIEEIPLTLEEALEITGGIAGFQFIVMGIGNPSAIPEWLKNISLRRMLNAAEMVDAHNRNAPVIVCDGKNQRIVHVVPAERLIAAVFALLHYGAGARIASDGAKTLRVCAFKEHGRV